MDHSISLSSPKTLKICVVTEAHHSGQTVHDGSPASETTCSLMEVVS